MILTPQERMAQAMTKMLPGTMGGRSKVAQPHVAAYYPRPAGQPIVEPPAPVFAGRGAVNGGVTHSTSTIDFVADTLYLAAVGIYVIGPVVDVSSVVTPGLTWDLIENNLFDTVGVVQARLLLYRAVPSTTFSDEVDVTLTGNSDHHASAVVRVDNVTPAGSNGSGSIVQSATGAGTGAAALATLGAPITDNNATIGVFGFTASGAPSDLDDAFTPGNGYTEDTEFGYRTDTGGNVGFLGWWGAMTHQAPGSTTVDGTFYASNTWGAIGVEVAGG